MTAADTYAILAQQAALYGRDSSQRIAELIEAGDALAAMLQTCRTCPTSAGGELIALHLAGMQRAANQLTAVMLRENSQ